MLKKFTLLTLFYCGFLSAGNLSHIDMELMLTQSAMFFENAALSELNFHENKEENERYFSFCLLENQHWGITSRNKSIGYWINQDSQQPELLNCQRTISLQEFEGLLQYVLTTEAKKSRWTIERQWLCYSKESNSNTASICHLAPILESYATNRGAPSMRKYRFYKYGFWIYTTVIVPPLACGSLYALEMMRALAAGIGQHQYEPMTISRYLFGIDSD